MLVHLSQQLLKLLTSRDATEAVETALDDAEKALKPTDVKLLP